MHDKDENGSTCCFRATHETLACSTKTLERAFAAGCLGTTKSLDSAQCAIQTASVGMVRIGNDIFKRNLVLGRSWPALRDVKALAAGTKVEPPGATFGPRRQFCWEFIWVREGSLSARIDDVAVEGSPGTVLLIPPRAVDVYDWSPRQRTSHSFLHFDFAPPPAGWPERSLWPLKRQ